MVVGAPPVEGVVVEAAVAGKLENSAGIILPDRNQFGNPASETGDATITATIFAGQSVNQKEA